jgi:hypothetical protein
MPLVIVVIEVDPALHNINAEQTVPKSYRDMPVLIRVKNLRGSNNNA